MVEETKSILSTEEDLSSSRMPLTKVLGTSGINFNTQLQSTTLNSAANLTQMDKNNLANDDIASKAAADGQIKIKEN